MRLLPNLNEITGPDMKTLYIDMDNVLVDFPSGIARTPEHIQDQYEDRLDEVPGIFYLLDPIPGAIAAYEALAPMFDTYILSTAPGVILALGRINCCG